MTTSEIIIRPCISLDEIQSCIELQKVTWQEPDIEIAPPHVMVAARISGGQVLGAFEGERMIGFVFALAAIHDGRPSLHSHMAAVLPAYQNRGIGRLLKLKQREEALSRSIDLIKWTFDPMEIRNAHFNINRLGVIVRRFLPNLYGITPSPLHSSLPTDRLVAEWHLRSDRVGSALSGQLAGAPREAPRITLPANIGEMKNRDRQTAGEIQMGLRKQFQSFFARHYAITGFEIEKDRACYVLEKEQA